MLNAEPTDWLLNRDNPSMRYFTLREILELPDHDPEVVAAKKEIMRTGIVPSILSQQKNLGYCGIPDDFNIRSKYKGTVWNLIVLAELGGKRRRERR